MDSPVSGTEFDLISYCDMYYYAVKTLVSCTLYRQSIPFIEYFGEKERRECRM